MAIKKGCIGGVILGELESPQRAEEYANRMKSCPHLLFSQAEGNTLCSVYIVSKRDQWWLEYPEKNPARAGFRKAKVYIGPSLHLPFSVPPRRPHGRAALAPCGADCRTCDLRNKYKCRGCPEVSDDHK